MEPSEPPPPYSDATAGRSSNTTAQDQSHLQPPLQHQSSIPPEARRSIEDESRPLPPHWVRQYDTKTHHQFFVDTSTEPPRSIWHHPYDDERYLSTLTPAEREYIKSQQKDLSADQFGGVGATEEAHDELPPREEQIGGVHKFGRKVKDKLTHSTHEEREADRKRRDEEDERLYRQHQHIRAQMAKAMETGEPQLLGRDRDGKDVYIEPPQGYGGAGYGGGYGGGFGGYSGGGYGIDPYGSNVYGRPNARYIRPETPYGRPYGYGYGGGLGLPLLGGFGGGLLLGGLLF